MLENRLWSNLAGYVAAACMIAVLFGACACADAQCIICPVTGNAAFPVSPNVGDQQAAAIYGDIVVWEDYRNEAATKGDIYCFDLRTLTESPVCVLPGEQWMPAIYGDTIVWQDARNTPTSLTLFDIYSYSVSSHAESPVSVNPRTKWNPAIFGSRVVWEERASGSNYDIKSILLDQTGAVTACAAVNGQYEAAIYGDTVVWQDFRSGTNDDIYSYNLSTGVETPVCTAANDQIFPEIWGTKVVWEDYRSGSHIYMKDLATGVETKLTSVTSDKWAPSISGKYVVWQDKRNGNWDLYMYNLATGVESPLIVCPGDQQFPRVHGDKVAFQCGSCGSGGTCGVYITIIGAPSYQDLSRVSAARPVADGTAVQLTGKVVTRSFGGIFYVQEDDRSAGIRVVWPASITPGTIVNVKGRMATKDGEREIEAVLVEEEVTGTVPRPLFVTHRDMGGEPSWAEALPWIGGGVGAENVGLLIATAGRVESVGSDYFYLTDGSLDGQTGDALPVKVLCGSLAKPVEDQMVLVTGISSASPFGAQAERAVRVQYQSDITQY